LGISQIFARAPRAVKLRSPVSTLEKRIHDLVGERHKWEETAAKYKHRSGKLKKEKGPLEAKKTDLECQLKEARS